MWTLIWAPMILSLTEECPNLGYTEKTILPIPFTLNWIWSWWQFSIRFLTKCNYIWFKIERRTVITIIFHSIWKENENLFLLSVESASRPTANSDPGKNFKNFRLSTSGVPNWGPLKSPLHHGTIKGFIKCFQRSVFLIPFKLKGIRS